MKRCKPNLAAWIKPLPLLLAPVLHACVLGNDSDPPVLYVDLYWEDDRHGDRTCSSARVAKSTWELTDRDDQKVAGEEDDRCHDGFSFVDVGPGDYVLKVVGYTSDDKEAWSGSCDLSLDRFDRTYACRIDKVDSTTPRDDSNGDADAGAD